jgi:hypothetical protein
MEENHMVKNRANDLNDLRNQKDGDSGEVTVVRDGKKVGKRKECRCGKPICTCLYLDDGLDEFINKGIY